MIESHWIASHWAGLAALVAVAAGWVAVQRAWARAFPDAFQDPDVLAERIGCHGCACSAPCPRPPGRGTKESS